MQAADQHICPERTRKQWIGHRSKHVKEFFCILPRFQSYSFLQKNDGLLLDLYDFLTQFGWHVTKCVCFVSLSRTHLTNGSLRKVCFKLCCGFNLIHNKVFMYRAVITTKLYFILAIISFSDTWRALN
jgi:hypothetical protein